MAVRTDLFESPDYFQLDELLSEEHLMVRKAVRDYVKKEISPIIEDYAQRAEFPTQIIKQLGDMGCFGPTVPAEYGGGGLDYISYGIMMQELERGDSGIRSFVSVQSSLVMYPIIKFLERRGVGPRGLSVGIVYLGTLLIIGAIFAFLGPLVIMSKSATFFNLGIML